MERKAMQQLIWWKEKPQRKPMLITGCRQCGKTWLMTEFGKRHFEHTVQFNFEKEPGLAEDNRDLRGSGTCEDSQSFYSA